MKNSLLFFPLILYPFFLHSQGVSVYSVSRQTGISYSSISATGASVSSWRAGANLTDNRSFPIPVGFSFNYIGTTYSQVSVSLNGFIDFSSNGASGNTDYPYGYDNSYFSQSAPNGTVNAIAPYYEDIQCSVGVSLANSIKYQTTGTAGTRVFTVEWINMAHQIPPYDQKVNFQVKLYEVDGDIEFIYGSMSGSGISLSYTCGINTAALTPPPTPQQLLTQQVPNTTTFSNTPQNSLFAIPESYSKILFDGCILPSAAGTVTGSATICGGTSGLVYSVTAIANATGYSWTLPAGFTITAGSNTNVITVDVDPFASSGDVIVNGTNSCGSGDPSSKPVTVNSRPIPTITGNPSTCSSTSGYAYSTQTGMTGYIWTISSGGTITSGSGTSNVTVTWNTAGSQSISVNYTNPAGCTATTPTSFPVQVNPRPVPTLSGPGSVCVNTTGNVYTTESGMTNYTWAVSSGGTVTAGGTSTSNSVTITWTTAGNRSVSVTYTNSDGCQALTPTVYPVTVNPLPVPVVSGPTSVCVASTGNVYTTQSGMAGYVWTISPGGTFTSPTDTYVVTVTWNTAGNRYITVNYNTVAGCTTPVPDTLDVTVNNRPAPTISGPSTVCEGTAGYVYTTQSGMTNYQWSLSSGGTITGGSGTNSITVIWTSAGSYNVLVNYTNPSGCNALSPVSFAVTVNPQPAPSITGPTPVCQGVAGNQYTTQSGMTGYAWSVSPGNTVTAGGTSVDNYAYVTWNVAGTQQVYVNYTNPNGCTAQTATSYAVTTNSLPTPTIAGPSAVCVNTGGHIYTTQSGQTGYSWTVSAGGSITSGTGTNSITVTWNTAGAQSVSVNYQNTNGCTASLPTILNVTVDPIPVPVITGNSTACQGTAGNVYSTASGMTNYQWNVSAGGTVTAGGTPSSNTVTVTWNSAGSNSVNVGYTNTSGCTSASPSVKNVTVYPLPSPTITGAGAVCAGTSSVTYTTEAGMTGYTWNISAGGTISSGTGTNTITVTWNTAGAQTVTVNYINTNGCTAATPTVKNVTVNPLPVPTISFLPLMTESFENGGSIPTGWVLETLVPGNTVSFIPASVFPPGYSAYNGNWFVRFDSYIAGNGVIRLKRLSPVSTIGLSNVSVDFAWLESSAYPSANDRVEVEWSVDGTTWNSAGAFPRFNVIQGWKVKTQTLPVSATGQASLYIAFKFTSEFGNDCYLDLAHVTVNYSTVCAGNYASYQTEAGMTAYTWTVSSGGTITGGLGTNSITVLWNTSGSKTVGTNYTNSNGCKAANPTFLPVTVNPLPVPTISGQGTVCAGATGVTYTTEPGMTGYTWTVSAGGMITAGTGTNIITVTWSTAGAQTVTVNYTNQNGCFAVIPAVKNVTVNPLPSPGITGEDTLCAGVSNVIYSTETGMTGYFWTISAGGTITSGSNTSTVTVSWNTAGPQSISVNYTNALGCTAATPSVVQVLVNPRPVPTISGPDTVCITVPGNLYTTETGMLNYSWIVSPGGTITAGGTSSSSSVTVTWTILGNRSVSVNYTNINGCQATAPTVYPVTVTALPNPVIYGPASACAPSIGNIYTTQPGMASYAWSVSPGGTITSPPDTNVVSVTWNTPGNRYITVNYFTPAGCTAPVPDTLNVTVYARPVPTITGPQTVCAGTGGHVYVTQPGMTNYQWSLSGGGTIISGTTTNTIMVVWDSAGNHNVLVNYTNASGCSALTPASYPVTVNPHPVPLITGPTPVCQGVPGKTYITQTGMLGYIWNLSPGNTVTAGGTSMDNYITVTWNVTDTQYVYVNYTNIFGCTAQTAGSFAIRVDTLPMPVINGPDTVCAATAGHHYTTQAGMTNYAWSLSAGGTITAGNGTDSITVTWNTAGAQSVSINFANGNGCMAATPTVFPVLVNPLPVPVITGPASACVGTSGYIYATASGMSNYIWTISSGGTITSGGDTNVVTVAWDSVGSQTINVSYTNANGCTSAAPTVKNVTVHPLPVPTISGPANPCVNSGNYTYSTEAGMTGYLWTVSSGGTISSGAGTFQIQVTWFGTGAQWVSVNYTNANGCSASVPSTLPVTVESLPGTAGTITGTSAVCGPETGVAYSVDPITNASSYLWTVPPGATIAGGAGTPAILVDYAPNSSSGTVTVTGTNFCGNGSTSPPFPVTFTPIPPAPVITQSGDLLISNAQQGNQWILEGIPIPGATAPTYLAQVNGEYWDQVIINDCASDTSNHIYVIVTGTEESIPPAVTIFPNPNDGMFAILLTPMIPGIYDLILYDVPGKKIAGQKLTVGNGAKPVIVDFRPVPTGVYLLSLSGNTLQIRFKILVSH